MSLLRYAVHITSAAVSESVAYCSNLRIGLVKVLSFERDWEKRCGDFERFSKEVL